MPRPGDWDAIGLGGDPTPGDPEKISALAEGFQKMGGKAREIITAIEAVMNKNDDSIFVGQTAEALRGKVDKRLRGHVESVASAFENSASALREWRGVVVEQQAKADAALNAGRGLAEDDPERENQKNAAKSAGEYQSEQASNYAGRINGVSDIKMPISDCEVFWEAFKWLAIILIIPALIFGGPIALIALGVNLALFIKTIVDVAKGDAGFLDLFLAGLGLIAPTTKALPIFSIIKAVGKGVAAGVKGIAQTFKTVFSKDFLFSGLLTGLKSMPMLANIAIKETGLFVVKNLRNFPVVAANFGNNFGKITLGAFDKLTTSIGQLPSVLGKGFSFVGKGLGSFLVGTGQFLKAHFGDLQWTRIFLPVAADEIRAFKALGMTNFQAFTQALKVGVVGRGVFAKDVFGLPMTGAIGKGISAIPIDTGAGATIGKTGFLHNLMHPEIKIPIMNIQGIGNASGAGFNAGHSITAIDDITIGNLGAVKTGDMGISVHTPSTVTQSGIHLPGNAGTHLPDVQIGNIPAAHIGTPQLQGNIVGNLPTTQVNQAVLPIHIATGATPPPVHVNTPHLGANGVVANIPSPHVGTAEFGNSLHMNNVNVQSQALNNLGSLHVPTPASNSTGLSDLTGSAIRNNTPIVPQHFGTSIGEGAAHGFQTNHFSLSIDEVLNSPAAAHFNGIHALNPPAVDRINAALDLVHNPGATTQGVTPPAIHTAKAGEVNVNVHLAGGDLKTPAPSPIKIDSPGLNGAQNTPTVPTVNLQPVTLPNRAADLHIQPANLHTTGEGATTLPSTNLPGNVGVPGHGAGQHGINPETPLVALHPQPAPHTPGLNNSSLHTPGLNNPGLHTPGIPNPASAFGKSGDIGHMGLGSQTIASKTDIPLPGLAERPGAYVTVERTEGGMSSFSLYGGGPDGRMDVLAGGNLRFTDTLTGNTTRFDSSGIALDHGLRLTRTDGVLRPGDHIMVVKGGEVRVTTLTGDALPDVKIQQLDNGGIRLIDDNGVSFHYNAQGKLDNQPLSAAWDKDLAAKAGVFRQPGDTDAMVNVKMADFGQVQRAQNHFDNALDNVALHGHRGDGPSTGPAVGDQVHIDLRSAEADLTVAKTTFESKHGLGVDGIQQKLDSLTLDSLKERPRLLGGVSRSFDLPGGDGMRFELNGGQISFSGPKVDAFSSALNGRTLTITETGAAGTTAHSWTYSLGFGGRANQIGESFPLNGGLFDGQPLNLHGTLGNFDKAMVTDLHGNPLPVKVTDDGFVVASPQGPMSYDRSGGFHGAEPSVAGHLPKPAAPAHLSGDDLIRWNAQADISRTHLTAAAENKALDLLMKDVAGGSFTSKKGFEGYINPTALRDGTLVGKVNTFETMAKELAFKGPEDNITVYRGVSMDPASAKADVFQERLPLSTSSTMKFQDEWAKNGVNSNRVVFEIDVPPGHSKLSMAYPDGYQVVKGDAPEINASQFEVTLAPTTLVRTGPSRTLDNGITVVPVKAEQIPPSLYESVITAKWPGMSSETAFRDFVKSFELNNLKQFPDLENVTAKAVQSTDGLTHTVTVSKTGYADDLTITVMRDPKADSVRVTVAADGLNKFDKTWSQTGFSNIATDLRGGVLHNNEQFTNLPQPAAWQRGDELGGSLHIDVKGKGKAPDLEGAWQKDLAAKIEVFRRPGDTDAMVNAKFDDFRQVQQAQVNVNHALQDLAEHGHRFDGNSTDLPVGIQMRIELGQAQADLGAAKTAFQARHGMDVDGIQVQLHDLLQQSLKDRPRLPAGAPNQFPVPEGGAMFKIDGPSVSFTGAKADSFDGVLTGKSLQVIETGADGGVVRTLNYELNARNWPILQSDHLTLKGGDFEGHTINAEIKVGRPENATAIDVHGNELPARYYQDTFQVPSGAGAQVYDRGGNFLHIDAGLTPKLAEAVPPMHLSGDDLAKWTAQADLSRTHLTAAAKYDHVSDMMVKIREGAFTSKKGFDGYVDPLVQTRGLTNDVHTFNEVAKDLLFDGPVGKTTLYRGVAMDPASAKAGSFTERLPVSTSSNWDFQKTWAQGADPGKRIVFEIEVPAGHGKLSMSYPEGYKPGAGQAKAWNQEQFEVTLSPTRLEQTGEPFVRDGLTVVPVRAHQIPDSQLDDLISAKWPGMSSEAAFNDFAKAFDQANLQKFSNMSDVTATSKLSTDVNQITVSKPGLPGHDMTITVTRDPHADSVHVAVSADGKTTFSQSWSKAEFSNIATDLKAGTLHDNDLFVAMSKPAGWNKQPFHPQWEQNLAAKSDTLRRPGDSDAMINTRMEDYNRIQITRHNLREAELNFQLHGGRNDGSSAGGFSIGDQTRMDLDAAQGDLDTAKIGFKRKHSMDFDDVQKELGGLNKKPRLPGAGKQFEVPGGGVTFEFNAAEVTILGSRAGDFTGSIDQGVITVIQRGAGGEQLAVWTFKQGFGGRANLISQTIHLTGGDLAGETLNLSGRAGQLDGVRGGWPMRTVGDEVHVTTPGGPLRYGRDGTFHGPLETATTHLPAPVPPATLHGDPGRWTNQVDLSRTHLSAAATDKPVEHLMKDVMGGSFTSKRGFGGYVKPLALEDGTLIRKTEDFVQVTQDLLYKGPDREVTMYRGVSMDPASAQAGSFVERLPSSTSNNLAFQEEWAKNGAAGNRFVFEIEVPAGHGKLSMSYPPGYRPGPADAHAWNQSQWEVTLAPTMLIRTGENRIVDGMTIVPVKAEQIPVGQLPAMIRETPPPVPLQTAFDDFVGAFDQGSINRWDNFGDVTITKTTSIDGNLTTITAIKPGYAETLSIQIGKDLDASTVSVKIDGGATGFDKGWKNTDLGDLGAQLRGKVLHDSDLFLRLPQPGSWANEPVIVNVFLQGAPDGAHVKVGNTGGQATHEFVNGRPGATFEALPSGEFRLTDGSKSSLFGTDGLLIEDRFQLAGANAGHTFVHPVDGQAHFEGPNAHLFAVQDLGDDGFRVNGAQGHTQRYGADGVRLADGLALTDRESLRGVLFAEPNGAGGLHVVDVHGNPVPTTHATQLPNGQTVVTDTTMHDVQWFGRDGVRQGIGVEVAHADFPNPVHVYRAEGGALSFVDHLGTHLPEQVTVVPGGFRITDPGSGIARTFDDAGLAIDRRIPLHQPGVQPGQQLVVVHDVHGNLAIRTGADAPGPGTVELTAGGGYRAIDGGNYHVYDANGTHQTQGVAVTLPGENGFLEIGAHGAQRVDAHYQPLATHQVNFNAAAGEITVTRAGGHDVFDLQGVVVREVTDLDPLGASQLGGRITRDNTTGAVTWTDANGVQMPMPHRVTIDAQGNLKVEIHLNGSPRNGEYHQYNRSGQLTEQGFPVLNGDRQTQYTYVVDRANSTWTRTGGTSADGVFQHGKVEVTGVGNGQLKLISSSAKEVQVFERRWLPGGEIMDSFRKTDTLGFGTFNRRTTWATFDNTGGISNWGKREFDTSGFSWRDVDHNGRGVHHYQEGLQKYDNPIADELGPMGKAPKEITGHVIATRGAGDNWTWHRFDADGKLIASGDRTWERLGDGFTDRVDLQVNGANSTEIAQQKFGNWHGTSKANQYQEFKLEDGANGLERPGSWEIQGKAGKPIGTGTKLFNDDILSATRVGEQRPPVWFRDYVQRNPVPAGNVSHVANDARYQVYRWETTGATNPGHGVRYVAGDESFVDVGLDGRFVRFEGKLHDGSTLKVGDHIEQPAIAHPNPNGHPTMAWETDAGGRGWRIFDNASNSWQDVRLMPGPYQPGQAADWAVVRQSMPGGEVREFPELNNAHVWTQRDAHGNLVGSSHQVPPYGHNPPIRFIESTGAADRSNWTWRELDDQGVATGAGGDRFHFKGSRDESIAWDNSFRDFDAGGNLIRDRNMLDEGRFVESWRSGNGNWHSAEFDKFGQRVDGAMTFDRRWGNGDGQWSPNWSSDSTHFKDSTSGTAAVPHQPRFETPQHIGDGRPVRVREYHADAAGTADRAQWKEFDFDKVVRERALSGTNYLETDKLHGQWKLWDNAGAIVGERSETGLVFELRGGRLTLTGNEFDFRGAMTEFRGWNARIGDAQRQPWLMHSDWTIDAKTLRPQGDPLRIEANYTSYSRLLTQKMLLTASTEFVLDYAASLIIMAIIADAQNKPFSGTDALKALMNAAVGTTLRTVAGTALTETRLGGGLRDLKTSMGNVDGGSLITKRPNNNNAQWGAEWAGNTSVTKWRGGTFDYGFGMLMLPLTGFVNGTMNAAIFGVPGKDGKTHTVSGWQAVAEGGMSVATGYAIANSIGMLRTLGMGFGAGRFFQKGGIADLGIGFGLKFFEKGMASQLAPALRASMNPEWSRPNPQPQPLILPPGVNVPQNQPQVTSGGVVLPPGVQGPQTPAPQPPTP